MRISKLAGPVFILATMGLVQGCHDDIGTNALPSELQQLKVSLSAYQNINTAKAAGWDTQLTPCWYDHNQGGMGYHFGNTALIDATPSLQDPEAIIYEPQSNGSMKAVGLEYIVPITAWSSGSPPRLMDQDFTRNDGTGVYALHIWLWKDNPSGLYAPWNPDVSCDFAAEKEDRA